MRLWLHIYWTHQKSCPKHVPSVTMLLNGLKTWELIIPKTFMIVWDRQGLPPSYTTHHFPTRQFLCPQLIEEFSYFHGMSRKSQWNCQISHFLLDCPIFDNARAKLEHNIRLHTGQPCISLELLLSDGPEDPYKADRQIITRELGEFLSITARLAPTKPVVTVASHLPSQP